MPDLRIASINAREILDSRGRPTVEADVQLHDGTLGRASVPSGASVGRHEAVELRDGDPRRYQGLGVRNAVRNVVETLAPAVLGLRADDQRVLDDALCLVDGTPDKRRLGANAVLAVSLAACRAAATARGMPLYRHVADLAGTVPTLPLPMINIVSGGLHAGGQLDLQDVLVMPVGADSIHSALEAAVAVHAHVGDRVRAAGHPPLVADEGGWAPALGSNIAAIAWVADAISERAPDARIAVDVAASHLYDRATRSYQLRTEDRGLDAEAMIEELADWASRFPVVSIEDGLAEDDWEGWRALTARMPQLQLVGDDLFVTNQGRLQHGIEEASANAVLVKPNQVGTVSEALAVIGLAKAHNYRTIVSARSGETEDDFLADLAVGSAAGQIKVGSVTRSERLAKWNRLLRIEEELGAAAYVGETALRPAAGATRATKAPSR